MAHPFEKMFADALKQSTEYDNLVLEKADELITKGYQGKEVAGVLEKYAKGLIDPKEATVVREAFEEFAHYLED